MIFLLLSLSCVSLIIADDDYIINNEKCRLPNFPAFSEETKRIYVSLPYVNCTDLDLLTYTTVENNTAYLHIKSESLDQYYAPHDSIDCCYSYVNRKGTDNFPDTGISISDCESFNSSIALKNDVVWVKCYLEADKIYENVHTTIAVPESVEKKLAQLTSQKESSKKSLSVLFIVIDAVSRLNFERTMPLSRNFILEHNFTEYFGYNKIDDNTFPNFNALLTGLNLKQSNSICRPEIVGGLDNCPMIWYDFRDAGYVTAYAEDWPEISTYNYMKKGFKNPPTDYYFKPYMEAAKWSGIYEIDGMPYCAGPESQGERTLNIAKDFVKTFKHQPNFGMFWMNTFSHNHVNTPTRMDQKVQEFFKFLYTEGILDESMVILLSDHGVRFGTIRQTIQGWYEERLPMNFISIPPWFQKEHPEKFQNFKENSKKLTSTYDLYMTIQEVLASSVENYTMTKSRACESCRSFFSEIPEKRSCLDAGVPERWCTCIGKFERNHTELTPELEKAALSFIVNAQVLSSPNTSINKIVSSSITIGGRKAYVRIIFEADDMYVYQVVLKTTVNPIKFIKVIQTVSLWRIPRVFKY